MPYEDLVKQCPFLSQRASLPLDKNFSEDSKVPEIHISKSKKKRLKKKLKAISSNQTDCSNKNIEPGLELKEREMALNPKSVSVSDVKPEKEVEQSKRVNDVVDGEISFSRPKVNAEYLNIGKEIKKKTKQNKKEEIKGDSVLVTKQGQNISERKNVQQESGDIDVKGLVTSSKKSDSVVSKEDNLQSIAQIKGSEKSREEIIAQREAKKKSKELKKQKEIDISQETLDKQSHKVGSISNAANVFNKDVSSSASLNKVSSIPEKSREEVIAEREAKKKAKQLAKQKKVDKSEEAVSDNSVVDPKQLNSESIPSLPGKKHEVVGSNIQVGVKNDIQARGNKGEGDKSKSQLRAERRALQVFKNSFY